MGQQYSHQRQLSSLSLRGRLDSSERSRERAALSRTKSVHENLVRERGKKVMIEDVYEVIGKIGNGALCEIYKLQKNKDKIGGSSRPELQRKKFFNVGRFLSDNDSVRLKKAESFQLNPLYFALKVINLKLVKEDKIDQLKNEVECVPVPTSRQSPFDRFCVVLTHIRLFLTHYASEFSKQWIT